MTSVAATALHSVHFNPEADRPEDIEKYLNRDPSATVYWIKYGKYWEAVDSGQGALEVYQTGVTKCPHYELWRLF